MQEERTPFHLGIIIDGNRRWARKRNLPTLEGHRRGADNVKRISEEVWKKGVKILTIYAFSSENWNRSKEEVRYLVRLIGSAFSKKYVNNLMKKGVKLNVIGERKKFPKFLLEKVKNGEKLTKNNKKGILNLAVSYGGRLEIIYAVKKIISKKVPASKINEELINQNLWTKGIPYPDFIIRTGGERRLSNFLTWQSAYSELYFVDKYWPDFNKNDLESAFVEYSRRQRRFGR